jgi:hypothetical protein
LPPINKKLSKWGILDSASIVEVAFLKLRIAENMRGILGE